MRDETAARLLQLNQGFYQTFAAPFAETRGRVQPGVLRSLQDTPDTADILDLGCGNGEVARELARRGHRGRYLGLDWSQPLLDHTLATELPPSFSFRAVDLSTSDWIKGLEGAFARVFAFAVLHHIPGSALRLQLCRQARRLLHVSGRMVVSIWDFLSSPRLTARVVPWSTIGLSEADVDRGDYLIDWRRGGLGLRYVHHFSEAALLDLAGAAGFHVHETYRADGKGGRLALYQVWGV